MLTEPNINKNRILSLVKENYNISITNLTFLKGGEASWGYKVDTENGEAYFFKIHTALNDFDKRFELTYRLYNNCDIKNITHPIKNRSDKLVVMLDQYPTALFNFISGSNSFVKPFDHKKRFELGQLLGRIHEAKYTIGDFLIREDFIYGNTQRLLNTLGESQSFMRNKSKYKRETAQLLVKHKHKILRQLGILKSYGDELRGQNLDFVICHGEPHKWNTMTNEQGEVFLIDWDDSIFAPKEKDLNMVKDDPTVLEGYKHIIGKISLNEAVINYYNLEWSISEIDAWSTSLLYEESNDVQNSHYLEEFENELQKLNNKIADL